ncbi:hypothetical protein ACIBIZ_48915 [Nonomuraea spiralis]|uniref:Uncharacterized protein n=1 Tax=Nonomuraea spiralis TaxID=46182 RepID=A0ABV5ISE4_9ACTN|nr:MULTISPECIES: hypothetical protein [Nonomuraea]GGT38109.1 hypothetical protein GCM10010176_097830 [Nonomuraea spiralis]
MFEIVSALVPPIVVGGAFIAGVVRLVRSESRAKETEGRVADVVRPEEGQGDGPARSTP